MQHMCHIIACFLSYSHSFKLKLQICATSELYSKLKKIYRINIQLTWCQWMLFILIINNSLLNFKHSLQVLQFFDFVFLDVIILFERQLSSYSLSNTGISLSSQSTNIYDISHQSIKIPQVFIKQLSMNMSVHSSNDLVCVTLVSKKPG